ncbi:hypothetical protein EXIGLDRAFT_700828 [Exidia glandulosa HHB12029]|uniref:Uncharacterized protein n=1 Tax=Exidia glandulosa HHB12029 TaxID=1314781 RepID=A0A165DA46_EXIGL|nr:hypothetical protein EXIGLDRAFT_700828 [Exidia glandulosa HHB12029]
MSSKNLGAVLAAAAVSTAPTEPATGNTTQLAIADNSLEATTAMEVEMDSPTDTPTATTIVSPAKPASKHRHPDTPSDQVAQEERLAARKMQTTREAKATSQANLVFGSTLQPRKVAEDNPSDDEADAEAAERALKNSANRFKIFGSKLIEDSLEHLDKEVNSQSDAHLAFAHQVARDNGFPANPAHREPFAVPAPGDDFFLGFSPLAHKQKRRAESIRSRRTVSTHPEDDDPFNPGPRDPPPPPPGGGAAAAAAATVPAPVLAPAAAAPARDGAPPDAPGAGLPPPLGKLPPRGDPVLIAAKAVSPEDVAAAAAIDPLLEHTKCVVGASDNATAFDGHPSNYVTAHLDPQQAADWIKASETALAAQLFRRKGVPVDPAVAVSSLRQHLKLAFPDVPDIDKVQAAPARHNPAHTKLLVPPQLHLLFNLPPVVKKCLEKQCAWVFGDIAFTVRPVTGEDSEFICTFEGLTTDDEALARRLFIAALGQSEELEKIIEEHGDALPTKLPPGITTRFAYWLSRFQAVIVKLKAPRTSVPIEQYNVYAPVVSKSNAINRQIRILASNIQVFTSFYGTGVHIPHSWLCSVCRSCSHPAGLCPYLSMPHFPGSLDAGPAPSWSGPGEDEDEEEPEAAVTEAAVEDTNLSRPLVTLPMSN